MGGLDPFGVLVPPIARSRVLPIALRALGGGSPPPATITASSILDRRCFFIGVPNLGGLDPSGSRPAYRTRRVLPIALCALGGGSPPPATTINWGLGSLQNMKIDL